MERISLYPLIMTLHKRMIQVVGEILRKYGGNRTNTAKELGITVKTLRTWIQKNDELAAFRKGKLN